MSKRFATLPMVAAALLLGACAGPLSAPGRAQGYVVDSRNAVVKDPFSLCWRTGYWTPALAIAECDPTLAAKPGSQIAAPRAAAPVPSPAPVAPREPAAPPIAQGAPGAQVAPSAPSAPSAPTAPSVAAAPAAPKRCDGTVTLQSDELFAFNSATLSGSARSRVETEVVNRLAQCANVEVVIVTGHTDRIGSQQYNLKLSERRAAAVTRSLTGKGVPAAKIETMGMGKTAPAKFCPDSRSQKELIACLAPNRRVTVEVKGPAK